jgi:hypothetical protein
MSERMGPPSSWNTPIESPLRNMVKVSGSSSGIPSMSGLVPVDTSMRSRARSMTERLRSPRKSILSRPRSSTPCISYWVTTGASPESLPSGLRCTGTYSVSGSSVMTTAAAWMPSWRRSPSRPLATSMTRLASASVSYMVRSSPAAAKPSSWPSVRDRQAASGVSRPMSSGGMALAILSPTM